MNSTTANNDIKTERGLWNCGSKLASIECCVYHKRLESTTYVDYSTILDYGTHTSETIVNNALASLTKTLASFPIEVIGNIQYYCNKFVDSLRDMRFSYLYATVTPDLSLFVKFSAFNSDIQFRLEAFSDYNPDSLDDIEATLHIYKAGKKESAIYGKFDDLVSIIRNRLHLNTTYSNHISHALPQTLSTATW